MTDILDCRTCGLCCICLFDQDVFCDVTSEDEERLDEAFVRKNVVRPSLLGELADSVSGRRTEDGAIKTKWRTVKTGPLRGISVNACAALRGSIMNRVFCSVYKNRPDACRKALSQGDKACREVRKMYRDMIEQCLDGER